MDATFLYLRVAEPQRAPFPAAIITWNQGSLTFPDAVSATYTEEDYWRELNRRSQLRSGRDVDPPLRVAK